VAFTKFILRDEGAKDPFSESEKLTPNNTHFMDSKNLKKEALHYHAKGRPGKIEVIPTKETANQRDLSLAYSPGVAEPCLHIAENPEDVYKYTAKGNLVAVISNGTA